jgi:hypothetical protein
LTFSLTKLFLSPIFAVLGGLRLKPPFLLLNTLLG